MSAAAPSESACPFADLLRPEAYPHRPVRVELVETHISWVFLAGERVYKVKKPVDLGFLDFTRLERRRFYCEEEVRLNRRLAPGVYLGVVSIGRDDEGRAAIGRSGAPAEPAVEMRRLPAEGMLPALAARGAVGSREIESLAALLASFHRSARHDETIAVHGAPERVRFLCDENFAALLPWAGVPGTTGALVTRAALGRLRNGTHAFLDEHLALFRRRASERRIVEGHGDLHAGNLCFVDGAPLAFDAIEFADRFRCGDAACDLAFLTMDLKRLGRRDLARALALRYAALAEDDGALDLLPFYETYRALVRAKIAALRAGLPPHDHAAGIECRSYLALALETLPAAAEITTDLPELSTHREESTAMNILFQFEHYSLSEPEREKLKHDLEALGRVVEPFPVKDLHVHIHRHPHHGEFHVKLDLHLPGQVLFTGERGGNYHPAFTECAKQMIAKVKTYKDQLGHRRDWPEARPEKG